MKKIRAISRLIFLAFYSVFRVMHMMFHALVLGNDVSHTMGIRRLYSRQLLSVLGVKLTIEGSPPNFSCLVLSNHRSYLDPVLIANDVLGFYISKAEVEKWPVIGYGIKLSGVIFLKRESKDSRKNTLEGIVEKIKEGWPVVLFPEGTTTDLPTTAPFRLGSFQVAAKHGIPIVPVALIFGSKKDFWIGNDTLLPHFLSRFGEKTTPIRVVYGNPITGENAEELLLKTKNWINLQLTINYKL